MNESLSPVSSTTRTMSLPKTPQPPFSPPRRSSSLAFSHKPTRLSKHPLGEHRLDCATSCIRQPDFSQPNTARKRNTIPSCVQDGPPAGHVAQMQRVFQVAKATLHRDMFAASSPASSIESRMELDEFAPLNVAVPRPLEHVEHLEPGAREWRYSIAPQVLAEPNLDVREPLPSPTLPDLPVHLQPDNFVAEEPISSGFSSPWADTPDDIPVDIVMVLHSNTCDAQHSSTPHASQHHTIHTNHMSHSGLNQPLTDLEVPSDGSDLEDPEISPTVHHGKRRSIGSSLFVGPPQSPNRSIWLSESAEAAAESAKAKRKLLRDTFGIGKGKENLLHVDVASPATKDVVSGVLCPDPTLHYAESTMMCPDPLMHEHHLPSSRPHRASSRSSGVMMHNYDDPPLPAHTLPSGVHRATATGSPMPFTRVRSRPTTTQSQYSLPRASPYLDPSNSLPRPYRQPILLDGHFRPGWYHAQDSIRPFNRPAYSFSTAASKVMGFDQAPDSRIRDSYKTDTLTALARPPSRYRKNGLGAAVTYRGVSRYYQRETPTVRGYSQFRLDNQQSFMPEEVRFRSSPPRAADIQFPSLQGRKRAADDASIQGELSFPNHENGDSVHRNSTTGKVETIDQDSKAAVRSSIFGENTPEAFQDARHGIRELNPRIQVIRKGVDHDCVTRKKRRPSYWDNDLREIRESPAGRGGVNSPVSAQDSMQAEFEIASLSRSDGDLDDDSLVKKVAEAGVHLAQRLSIMDEGSTQEDESMEIIYRV